MTVAFESAASVFLSLFGGAAARSASGDDQEERTLSENQTHALVVYRRALPQLAAYPEIA